DRRSHRALLRPARLPLRPGRERVPGDQQGQDAVLPLRAVLLRAGGGPERDQAPDQDPGRTGAGAPEGEHEVSTPFPEWTSELEVELRTAYQTAPAEATSGGSRHTGLKAVYDLLKDKFDEQEAARLKREKREEAVRAHNTSMSNGPWDTRPDRSGRVPDVGIPPDAVLSPPLRPPVTCELAGALRAPQQAVVPSSRSQHAY